MHHLEVTDADRELVEAAREVIRRNFDAVHGLHTVGAAVRAASGRIYTGVNLYHNTAASVCCERIAVGAAISAGEREIVTVTGTGGSDRNFIVMGSCGVCRQFLNDYFPGLHCLTALPDGTLIKVAMSDLLPLAYRWEL